MIKPIYLDYNATTPHDPEVIAAMRPFLEQEFGNPSSSHWYGIKPKQAVEKAREQISSLLNCRPKEVVFTSGGTESNNHAIKGIAYNFQDKGKHIITTEIEHPAVLEVCRYLEGAGFKVIDLGKEVTAEKFINTIKKEKADILAMSALITTTMPYFKQVVDKLKQEKLNVKVMVGGAPVTLEFAKRVGADAYAEDAPKAVQVARNFMTELREKG